MLRTLSGHKDAVNWCCFSPDGKWIASASNDYTLKVLPSLIYWSYSLRSKLAAFFIKSHKLFCVVSTACSNDISIEVRLFAGRLHSSACIQNMYQAQCQCHTLLSFHLYMKGYPSAKAVCKGPFFIFFILKLFTQGTNSV